MIEVPQYSHPMFDAEGWVPRPPSTTCQFKYDLCAVPYTPTPGACCAHQFKEFNMDLNFRTYNVRTDAPPILAIRMAFEALDMTYHKESWGPTAQTATAGDWLVQTSTGDVYTIKADIFPATYREVPGLPHFYQKFGSVEAAKATQHGTIQTLEGETAYAPGDMICRGPAGDMWAVNAQKFDVRYVLAPEV